MFARFFRWLFTPYPHQSAPAQPTAPRRQSVFTTGPDDDDYGPGSAQARIEARVWGPTGKRAIDQVRVIPPVDGAQSKAFAMDDSGGAASMKAVFALGAYGVPDIQAMWYGAQSFIGYQMCAIIAQQWLVQKACFVPARDAVRKGFTVTSNDGSDRSVEILAAIEKANKRYRLKQNLVEFANFNRVFGIRVAMFKFKGKSPEWYTQPFNPDSITPGSYEGIAQIDPYWVVPELTTAGAMDPSSIRFYDPDYWIINGVRVHRSHLVVIRGAEVADVLKPSYMFGGISIPQRVFERVYAAERCANEAPQLMLTKRATIFYTDVAQALANQLKFSQRMETWLGWLSNHGVKVADKDADKIEQLDTSLTDTDVTIMTQYQLVAAAANMPATKLLGTTPKGMNATGEYDEANYHEELETIQADLDPLIERHHLCVIRSDVAPAFGIAPFAVDVEWNPLDSPTAKELAETNLAKATTDKTLMEAGAIDGHDSRSRIARDPRSGYDGIEVLPRMEPLPDAMDDPLPIEPPAPPAAPMPGVPGAV